MCIGFVLLAHGTAFYILVYELCKTQPPELGGDKLVSFEITRVTSSLIVMAAGEDGTMEGVFQGNIDTSFVY